VRAWQPVSCELDLMGLDQPRYVVVNGWPEGSHLNEVMATRGGVSSVTSTREGGRLLFEEIPSEAHGTPVSEVGANLYRPKFDDRPLGVRVRVGTARPCRG
jgi:hypothetical protein